MGPEIVAMITVLHVSSEPSAVAAIRVIVSPFIACKQAVLLFGVSRGHLLCKDRRPIAVGLDSP
jgi:hypothetical protein